MGRYVAFQLAAYPPRNAPDPRLIRRSSVRETHFNARRSGRLSVEWREATAKGEDLVTASSESYAVDEARWHPRPVRDLLGSPRELR
jgi:hypothetical protein